MNSNFYRIAIIIGLCVTSINALGALSPAGLNLRDLDTMRDFIRQHPKVADSLELIDVVLYTIKFGNGCEARFIRKKTSIFGASIPGPQPDIEFNDSTCSLFYDANEKQ